VVKKCQAFSEIFFENFGQSKPKPYGVKKNLLKNLERQEQFSSSSARACPKLPQNPRVFVKKAGSIKKQVGKGWAEPRDSLGFKQGLGSADQ